MKIKNLPEKIQLASKKRLFFILPTLALFYYWIIGAIDFTDVFSILFIITPPFLLYLLGVYNIFTVKKKKG